MAAPARHLGPRFRRPRYCRPVEVGHDRRRPPSTPRDRSRQARSRQPSGQLREPCRRRLPPSAMGGGTPSLQRDLGFGGVSGTPSLKLGAWTCTRCLVAQTRGSPNPPFRSYRPPDTGSVPIGPVLEQSLRNRFSLVARRVSLGLLLRAHTRRVGSGWLFTEGLFPPTRSSALTISQFQQLDPTRDRPGHQDSFIFFNVVGPPLLPGPHTMWGVLKPGASAAEENWWDRSRSATSG